jgi:Icc protein
MSERMTRREALQVIGVSATGVAAANALAQRPHSGQSSEPAGASVPVRKRTARIAHLTDIHVEPERRAGDGMIACLHHVQSLKDPPNLILNGGDSIMDSYEADDVRTKTQWDLWRIILKNECSIPVNSCIGNHDIWGWNRTKSGTTGNEVNYGKKRAIDMLEIPARAYSLNYAGWHIAVLDSTQSPPDGGVGYVAGVDDEQFDWLARDLSGTPPNVPVLVLSHMPILSAAAFLWAKRDEDGVFRLSGSLMHQDWEKLKDLLAQHPNVKLCLSGHLHHVDRVDYNGVTYLCNGAVSGNWWKGRHKDCDEGYAIIDLYDDGSFEHEYVKYGWKAGAEQKVGS